MKILLLLVIIFLLACSGGQEDPRYTEAFNLEPLDLPGETLTMEEAQPDMVFDEHLVTAQQGAAIVGWNPDTKTVMFIRKCSCGNVLPGKKSAVLSPGAAYRSSFRCPKCKQAQEISIACDNRRYHE